jgi:hypothetical protein
MEISDRIHTPHIFSSLEFTKNRTESNNLTFRYANIVKLMTIIKDFRMYQTPEHIKYVYMPQNREKRA